MMRAVRVTRRFVIIGITLSLALAGAWRFWTRSNAYQIGILIRHAPIDEVERAEAEAVADWVGVLASLGKADEVVTAAAAIDDVVLRIRAFGEAARRFMETDDEVAARRVVGMAFAAARNSGEAFEIPDAYREVAVMLGTIGDLDSAIALAHMLHTGNRHRTLGWIAESYGFAMPSPDSALARAYTDVDLGVKSLVYLIRAQSLLRENKNDRASLILDSATTLSHHIPDPATGAQLLVESVLKLQNLRTTAEIRHTLERALDAVRRVEDASHRGGMLVYLARRLAALGSRSLALRVALHIRGFDSIPAGLPPTLQMGPLRSPVVRTGVPPCIQLGRVTSRAREAMYFGDRALLHVVTALAQARKADSALSVSVTITTCGTRSRALLATLPAVFADRGIVGAERVRDEAFYVGSFERSPRAHYYDLAAAVATIAIDLDTASALVLMQSINDPLATSLVLRTIADSLISRGRFESARSWLDSAAAITESISDDVERIPIMRQLAESYAAAKEPDAAVTQLDMALDRVRALPATEYDGFRRGELRLIGAAFGRIGFRRRAERVLLAAADMVAQVEDEEGRCIELVVFAVELARLRSYRKARQIADRCGSPVGKLRAYAEILSQFAFQKLGPDFACCPAETTLDGFEPRFGHTYCPVHPYYVLSLEETQPRRRYIEVPTCP